MEISPTFQAPVTVQPVDRSTTASVAHAEALALNRKLHAAVRTLNDSVVQSTREFSFAIDPKTHHAVIRIVDTSAHELIEQVPSEYILRVAQALKSAPSSLNSGNLVDETV